MVMSLGIIENPTVRTARVKKIIAQNGATVPFAELYVEATIFDDEYTGYLRLEKKVSK